MSGHEIRTERLRLRLMTAAETRALLDGAEIAGVAFHDGYPTDGTLVAAAMIARLLEDGVDPGHFGQYMVVREADGQVIGDIGFHSPPDEHGDVSLGFGIVPGARGQGYASEALAGMLGWALGRPEIRRVHADTDLINLASQHVLAGAGMTLVEDGPDRKIYEIRDV